MLGKIPVDRLLHSLQAILHGQLTLITPDGVTRIFPGLHPGPAAQLHVHDWRVFGNLVTGGNVAFARDYQEGCWDTDDLPALLTLALLNDDAIKPYILGNGLARLWEQFLYMLRANTRHGSRQNIHAHYDLGNDFYRLWLDPGMTYSSALYATPHDTLELAQQNKYDRLLEHMACPEGAVLEIGCGWGGFAERARARGNCTLKGITLSAAQASYARARLGAGVDIACEDYRQQQGSYDAVVSIEMFEAVGLRYWPAYFATLKRLLKPGGRALIQTITIDEAHFNDYRTGSDFIRSHIFPGGMLASEPRFIAAAAKQGLKATDSFAFGADYARTLAAWLQIFDTQRAAVAALGFDEKFIRRWRFYLAGCIAGFLSRRTDVLQIRLEHA